MQQKRQAAILAQKIHTRVTRAVTTSLYAIVMLDINWIRLSINAHLVQLVHMLHMAATSVCHACQIHTLSALPHHARHAVKTKDRVQWDPQAKVFATVSLASAATRLMQLFVLHVSTTHFHWADGSYPINDLHAHHVPTSSNRLRAAQAHPTVYVWLGMRTSGQTQLQNALRAKMANTARGDITKHVDYVALVVIPTRRRQPPRFQTAIVQYQIHDFIFFTQFTCVCSPKRDPSPK